jgi:hypothetical protein
LWHSLSHSMSHSMSHSILVLSHPFVFTFSLNSILPDLNQEHQISPGSLGPVVPTKIWS